MLRASRVQYAMPYIEMQRPITKTRKAMIQIWNCHISSAGMSTIYMHKQCNKSYLYIVSGEKRKRLNLLTNPNKVMMMKATKDTFSRLMLESNVCESKFVPILSHFMVEN